MTATVRACPTKINAPKVYGYRDFLPNDINAEVVLLEKVEYHSFTFESYIEFHQVPGESLDKVWHTLTSYQETQVCVRLVELLLKLFNYRGSRICTDLEGTGVNTRGASASPDMQQQNPQPIDGYPPILQSRPFTESPLLLMGPQGAPRTTTDYLVALSQRMDRIFTDPTATLTARAAVHPSNPPLSDVDISRIRDTWRRLGLLIPYHTGGFYIPGTLSFEARRMAYAVLQSRVFGIYHSDMQMSRFIIQIVPREREDNTADPDPNVILTLTGWEHAFRAPLWSCARLPLFLIPRPIPHELITWERQAYFRSLILYLMNHKRMLPTSSQWIIGYVFGFPERWFEGCLGSHWMYRDAIEVALGKLKRYWEKWRPDIPFPLEVGGAFLGPRTHSVDVAEPGGVFTESVNALAKASGTTAEEWELA
jgi:hypothetical protein